MVVVLCVMAIPTQATVWTFRPDPVDIYDLDHGSYYTWGIDTDFGGAEITEVTLTFTNIQDWIVEPNDILYMHLLDNTDLGVIKYSDYGTTGDALAGQGDLLGTWTDPFGAPYAPVEKLSFSFKDLGFLDEFSLYAADGRVGLGFDPDCHYWNDGVELTVESPIPEPGTLSLLGLGLAMIGGRLYRRKKK